MNAKNKPAAAAVAITLTATAIYYFVSNHLIAPPARYAGSAECARCHESIYARWKNTLHAGALIHDGELALLPEIGEVTARLRASAETAAVDFAIGRHWTRRYLLSNKRVSPFLYSIVSANFSDYYDKNYRRSDYELECAGCHTTGASAAENAEKSSGRKLFWAEAGVACEACHGPGSAHIEYGSTKFVTNPKKLTPERRDMICMSCHTNGRDKSGKFKFALGYKPGYDLQEYFFGMLPKPGQLRYNAGNRFDYLADGSFADRARQFEYWKFMFLAKEGLSCEDCLDFRGATNLLTPKNGQHNLTSVRAAGAHNDAAPAFFSVNEYCMSCHAARPPFAQYILATCENAIRSAKCVVIQKKISPNDARVEYSCNTCHASQSVHDHFYLVESERGGRR